MKFDGYNNKIMKKMRILTDDEKIFAEELTVAAWSMWSLFQINQVRQSLPFDMVVDDMRMEIEEN